jgi:membrane fusion protein, multidrug efflux system
MGVDEWCVSMKPKRLAFLFAGAAVAASAAYFFWPDLIGVARTYGISAVSTAKSETKTETKGETKRGGAALAPVMVAEVTQADMPVILVAPGTVEPLANVAVKPRVDGQIVEVAFKEGDFVEENSILFRLDDRMVKAQISQVEATIARDQAALRDAEATYARRQSLIANRVVTEAALDQSKFAVEGLKAAITAGQASLDSQRTQLDYLTIRAPISGRTGSLTAKLGATVRSQDALALVTINQTKPITVNFSLPQGELGALRRALVAKATADVKVPGGTRPAVVSGVIAFVDNQVDKQTGTISAKVVAENGDELLWPGQSVEVSLTVEIKPKMLSVPAAAVLPAQQGMIVWVVDADNKVSVRTVTVARIVGQTAYLSAGVSPGERLVTDGQIRLAPGASVRIEEPRRNAPLPASEERRMNGRG